MFYRIRGIITVDAPRIAGQDFSSAAAFSGLWLSRHSAIMEVGLGRLNQLTH